MPRTLRPCPSCARHVRPEEATCPFCDAVIPPCAGACAKTNDAPVTYRAAIVFATAAAAVAVGACGKEKREPDPVVVQPYGAPPMPVDASAQPERETTADAGPAPVAVYGPPPVDMKKK